MRSQDCEEEGKEFHNRFGNGSFSIFRERGDNHGLQFPTTCGFDSKVGVWIKYQPIPFFENTKIADDALLIFGVIVRIRAINGQRGILSNSEEPPQPPFSPAVKPTDSIKTPD